ncbi:dynamin family protein [Rubrivirga sp. IMCC45206]|uniref:dynamin family protein n=1 Tax=Rubrivirga sp. IMCC45206 TaxID=3391614 RepID=UPI00398F9C06
MDSPARAAQALLDRERSLLDALGALLDRTAAPDATRRRLADLASALDELFLLVVAGEFNAGKSTVVNALFGRRVMEEGPVPTTDKITVLRHGESDATHRRGDFVTERRLDHPLLEGLSVVDTPGTNSIVLEHQALTEDFIPRADLVLFVTSYDRPLSESERQFLEYIRGAWGKRLVVVVNKADLAETEAALAQVLDHVRDGLARIFAEAGLTDARPPILFPVAGRLALQAKLDHDTDAAVHADPRWQASRFAPFERFLTETLTDDARVALKLTAPLDAARTLLADVSARLDDQRGVLASDELEIAALNGRFAEVRAGMDETVARAVADVDRELLEMETRGVRFLDDTIRVSRLNLIRDRNAFREEFERQVVRDAERRIETRLGEAADAVLRRVFELWNETYTRLADLRRDDATAQGGFMYDREEVLRDVLREAKRTIDQYDMGEEARRLLENARSALTMGGAAAVGVGAVAVVLIATTAFDVTGGIVAAGALATLGFIVLPAQRRRAVREFSARVSTLRQELRSGLERELDSEVDDAIGKVRALVRPVAKLALDARAALDAQAADAARLSAEADALRADVRAGYGEVEG